MYCCQVTDMGKICNYCYHGTNEGTINGKRNIALRSHLDRRKLSCLDDMIFTGVS